MTSTRDLCANAAERGHLSMLQLLHQRGYALTKDTMLCACKAKPVDPDMLDYLVTHKCPVGITLEDAQWTGHQALVEYVQAALDQ